MNEMCCRPLSPYIKELMLDNLSLYIIFTLKFIINLRTAQYFAINHENSHLTYSTDRITVLKEKCLTKT